MNRIDNEFSPESWLMRLFRFLKLDGIAWSLRRVYCPVSRDALVLEVGSGGSPYYRSNVLCDLYLDTEERHFAPLVHDRPTVIAPVEKLPFRDNTFDFVIASHVLEHSSDPDTFLSEIQRVASAGYIEVPDAFMERLTHYGFHKLEISERDGALEILRKKDYIHDQDVVSLFRSKAHSVFPEWVSKYPFHFHIRYYWSKKSGGIRYSIVNPEVSLDWDGPQNSVNAEKQRLSIIAYFKMKVLYIFRLFLSQRIRNNKINLLSLMKCSSCNGDNLNFSDDRTRVACNVCGSQHVVFVPFSK